MINNDINLDRSRLTDRALDELIGICRGILFDGIVSEEEAVRLLEWLDANPLAREAWPGDTLHRQLTVTVTETGLDPAWEGELLRLLAEIVGQPAPVGYRAVATTTLPLDQPPPAIVFAERVFCLTGNFQLGPRRLVEEAILALGGALKKAPTRQTDYLVVGSLGSEAWMHSSFGRKIETAINLRASGHSLAIIGESHFLLSISGELASN